MLSCGQLVRPVDRKDREAMVEAALRGEFHLTFADNGDQLYFNCIIDGIHDHTKLAVEILADGRPVTLIGTDGDAETLFALRFGKFERVNQV